MRSVFCKLHYVLWWKQHELSFLLKPQLFLILYQRMLDNLQLKLIHVYRFESFMPQLRLNLSNMLWSFKL